MPSPWAGCRRGAIRTAATRSSPTERWSSRPSSRARLSTHPAEGDPKMPADVILSGFADEGPVSKRAEEQLALVRGLGLSHYSLRFVDVGGGVKNAMQLSDAEVERLRQ